MDEHRKEGDLLNRLPKHTPPWAVGLVTIIVAVSMFFTGAYLVARPEIQSVVSGSVKASEQKVKDDSNALHEVLSMMHVNMKQISDLTEALFRAQEENSLLQKRVSALEVDVRQTKLSLADCQAKRK